MDHSFSGEGVRVLAAAAAAAVAVAAGVHDCPTYYEISTMK
tara:strand:+ start:396 stop:518 length:123 start_codon:yes stop_codon:yes gene_type:complete